MGLVLAALDRDDEYLINRRISPSVFQGEPGPDEFIAFFLLSFFCSFVKPRLRRVNAEFTSCYFGIFNDIQSIEVNETSIRDKFALSVPCF